MDKQETRRVNPIAQITFFAVAILIIFEGLVIGGALELKAQTVEKYAPWAYEPFLRLVGEHPELTPRRAAVGRSGEPDSTVAGIAGFVPAAMPMPMETNDTALATNLVLEPSIPLPDSTPTNPPAAVVEDVVPVG